MQGYQPPPQLTSSKVQIFLACRNLKNVDFVTGVTDPFVTVQMRESTQQSWKQVGKTEMIKDNLNPDFERSFVINY